MCDLGFPGGSAVKNLPAKQESWVRTLGWEDLLEEGWQPTSGFLPGESHGQRGLVGYSSQARKETDTTEQLSRHAKEKQRLTSVR